MAGQELERREAAAPAMNALMPARPIDELARIAKAMARSNLYDILSKSRDLNEATSKAFVILLAGQELGIGTSASMANIYVIDGKPSFGAHLLGALVQRHPKYAYRKVERSDERAVIEWFELSQQLDEDGFQKRQSVGTSEFTIEDADTAGLLTKKNWQKSPKDMLWARAMTQGVRMHAPEVFGGPIYTPDEIEAGEANIEIGQVMVETEPLTRDLEDGTVIDRRTGEVIFDPSTDEHVEAEVQQPTEEVEKASETPAAEEEVVDVEPEPAASEAPAEAAQPTPAQDVPVITPAQHRLIRGRQAKAGLDDEMFHIVVLATTGARSTKEIPRDDVTQLVGALDRLVSLTNDAEGFAEAFGEYVESAAIEDGMPSS